MTLSELARRLGGDLVGADREFAGFATDSRDVFEGAVFLAIHGGQVDGHRFVGDALDRGAVCSVVTHGVDGPHILVSDLEGALAQFGGSLRAEFGGPVVGITGSNGKTSTKEFVAAALSPMGEVLKSEGNKNTQFTSPLLWHRMTPHVRAVVVEMGMRGFGQIKVLAEIARPTVGVITNIGTAHIEKVGDRAGICRAKSELLQAMDETGICVLPADSDFYDELKRVAKGRVLSFGLSQDADSRIVGYRQDGWSCSTVMGRVGRDEYQVVLPTVGKHQALNVAAAMAAAVACGVEVSAAAEALAHTEKMPMRMEAVERGGVLFLNDTYNASPDSMVAALEVLEGSEVTGRRIAVLGEMKELGSYEEAGHRMVGQRLGGSTFDLVVLTGGPTRFIEQAAVAAGYPASRIHSFESLDIEAVRRILLETEAGDVVLLKGSRALGLERALPEGED